MNRVLLWWCILLICAVVVMFLAACADQPPRGDRGIFVGVVKDVEGTGNAGFLSSAYTTTVTFENGRKVLLTKRFSCMTGDTVFVKHRSFCNSYCAKLVNGKGYRLGTQRGI